MTRSYSIARRALIVLMALAFLLPGPARTPADEVRAFYAAQGLLCDPGETSGRHRDAHCVLCLLPAAGVASAETGCAAPSIAMRVASRVDDFDTRVVAPGKTHPARAPPAFKV